jgi:hypothetical protein
MTLRVRFMGGDRVLRDRIEKVAREWSKLANVHFDFGNFKMSHIRVSFAPHEGTKSAVGTECLKYPQSKATMNFSWLERTSTEDAIRRAVLHEFGHALGFLHEHQSPVAGIPWNRERVYAYFKEKDGWSRPTVDENVFTIAATNQTNYSQFDPMSIMCYPIPADLTDGRLSVKWNSELSDTDKKYARLFYPEAEAAKPCEYCHQEFLPRELTRHVNSCPDNPWYWWRRGMDLP